MNLIDKAFGLHPQALTLRSQRSAVLASNIANSATPGYLARDYDFRTALAEAGSAAPINLQMTRKGHIPVQQSSSEHSLMYRQPTRSSGINSVEAEVEQSAFAENALRYQASLRFLSGSIAGLRKAIRGE